MVLSVVCCFVALVVAIQSLSIPVVYTASASTMSALPIAPVTIAVAKEEVVEDEPIVENESLDIPVEYSLTNEVDSMIAKDSRVTPHVVPFYSQFADITASEWQKVGCGIASLAMVIDFYSTEEIKVDELLAQGIAADAFLPDAGWIHAGLINLAEPYGLVGESRSMAGDSMEVAFTKLTDVVMEGPVMVSVHYTFEPTNPIPHLAVVTDIRDGRVYYNDPAAIEGQQSISEERFKRAWKQRYIEIRPSV